MSVVKLATKEEILNNIPDANDVLAYRLRTAEERAGLILVEEILPELQSLNTDLEANERKFEIEHLGSVNKINVTDEIVGAIITLLSEKGWEISATDGKLIVGLPKD